MQNKIMKQLSSLLAVIFVALFCVTGMPRPSGKIPDTPPAPPAATQEAPPDTTEAVPVIAETRPPETTPTEPPATEPLATEPPVTEPEPTEPEPTEPEPIQLTTAPAGYFEDALFIGDSRTVGLYEYGSLPGASFFATEGLTMYGVYDVRLEGTTLAQLLENQKFGKIYVMLGINEMGFDIAVNAARFRDLIDWIRGYQPDAIFYVQANLHVGYYRSIKDSNLNNARIDALNAEIAALADGQSTFYLDVNPLFDDASGNLADEYTTDNIHIMAKYYMAWAEWIAENAAVIPSAASNS